jgi:hypothetical protein
MANAITDQDGKRILKKRTTVSMSMLVALQLSTRLVRYFAWTRSSGLGEPLPAPLSQVRRGKAFPCRTLPPAAGAFDRLTQTYLLPPRATRSEPTCHTDAANNFLEKESKPRYKTTPVCPFPGPSTISPRTGAQQSGPTCQGPTNRSIRDTPKRPLAAPTANPHLASPLASSSPRPRPDPVSPNPPPLSSSSPLSQIEPSEAVIRSMRGAW